jgi:hypothetical protein
MSCSLHSSSLIGNNFNLKKKKEKRKKERGRGRNIQSYFEFNYFQIFAMGVCAKFLLIRMEKEWKYITSKAQVCVQSVCVCVRERGRVREGV